MIKKYITKKGETRYLFQTYLGIDPATGKEKRTTCTDPKKLDN